MFRHTVSLLWCQKKPHRQIWPPLRTGFTRPSASRLRFLYILTVSVGVSRRPTYLPSPPPRASPPPPLNVHPVISGDSRQKIKPPDRPTKTALMDTPGVKGVSDTRPKFMASNTNNCVAMHLFCHFNYRSLSDGNKLVNYLQREKEKHAPPAPPPPVSLSLSLFLLQSHSHAREKKKNYL